jgi:hypothetical protein
MKIFLLIATATLLLSACNRKELADSNRERDSLIAVVNERESSLNEFISSFNDVERNLDSVSARQHIIVVNSDKAGELQPNQKTRINNEIAAINTLMDDNRKRIAELNKKLKGSSNKNVQLEKMLVTLNDQLAQKEMELTYLNAKLNELNAQVTQLQISVDTLSVRNSMQAQTIAEETVAFHTAYYVVGKSNELRDAKIIDREGGLLGIGRTSKLNADYDNSKFTRIDYTQTVVIAVNGEMKIVTSHPSDSYRLENIEKTKAVKNLIIINPEKFWSASKYLVIVKE